MGATSQSACFWHAHAYLHDVLAPKLLKSPLAENVALVTKYLKWSCLQHLALPVHTANFSDQPFHKPTAIVKTKN